MMKAILLEKAGGVENFRVVTMDIPSIKDSEVLIENKAISINPVDYKVRGNEEILEAICGQASPIILGWDVAGTVKEVGSKVTRFKEGDKVFGMINFVGTGNAYAEYVAAPEAHLAKIPEGISFQDAAATTLAALTALQVLQPNVKKGDRVLIHAGSGGVGHFAVQIAKSLGAYVVTTSSKPNKDFVLSLGADEHIDYRSQKFEEAVGNIDFVFDMFNGEILHNSVKVVNNGGKIVSIPTPEFAEDTLALAEENNVEIAFHMVTSNARDMEQLARMLKEGSIKPQISKTYDFEAMPEAHLQQESGRTVGKLVVTL